jgi:hypothetical protein
VVDLLEPEASSLHWWEGGATIKSEVLTREGGIWDLSNLKQWFRWRYVERLLKSEN